MHAGLGEMSSVLQPPTTEEVRVHHYATTITMSSKHRRAHAEHGADAPENGVSAPLPLERHVLPAASWPLTTAEARVVDALAGGMTPKQIAHEWQLALATIRTHLRNAKRKTGARTLPHLAVMSVRADRAANGDDVMA